MKPTGFGAIGAVFAALTVAIAGTAAAYDYDENDPTQGAGAEAAWRVVAQWDQVDEAGTRAIHEYTTGPQYISPMVSYIPDDPDVPSPRDVLGYIAGTEGKLTRPEDEIRYFQALADASPRVRLEQIGTTEEGRPMHIVIVTDADNMARLEEYRGYTQQLADPRNLTDAEAARIVAQAKPIMQITAGLHSPETGPPEMVMELAYRLAVSKHPAIEKIRKEVILLITPITDVDGRAKVVDWYYRFLQDYDNRDYMPSMSPPYWGYYAYHDNNRDGIQMSLKLTQAYMQQFLKWHPVYSLDLHESVPLLYVSGGTGPYNPTIDPLTVREWQMFAHYELEELQRFGMPGVWTWGYYTGWNPSYLLWITNNHNSMGRFYETFGNLSARTMERELEDVEFAGHSVTERMWYNADPPPKKLMWSLRNNTNYMQSGVLASLRFLSNNGETLLENFYQKGKNSLREGREKAPYAWVIPREGQDPVRLAYLINQLERHAIEVHRATRDFEVKEGKFSAGDFVVRLDQPYGRHAKNLLAVQDFPKDAEYRPYDDVSWTLGLIYRVDTKPIEDEAILEMNDVEPAAEPVAFPGTVDDGDPEAYAVRMTNSNGLITARYMLERYEVNAAEEVFDVNGETFPAGSWIIPHRRGLRGQLTQVAEKTMLDFVALDEMPGVPMHRLDLPKLAVFHNWIVTQPDGWLRMTFDRAGVPYDYIADYTIRQGGLRRKYDVIVMADQGGADAKNVVLGRDPKFGPQEYQSTRDTPSFGRVDHARDITGGLGYDGVSELKKFLDDGGTLILLGSAGRLATDFGLLRNVDTSRARVNTPGSVVQTMVVRRDHPICYGYEDVNHVFRTNGPLYSVPEKFDHWIVLKYGTKPLREDEDETKDKKTDEAGKEPEANASSEQAGEHPLTPTEEAKPLEGEAEEKKEAAKKEGKFLLSGYVDGRETLEKSGAILDVPRNEGGRVVLFSFNPVHRYLNHGDFNYLFNALLNWNDYPAPEPKDDPRLAKD